MANISIYDARSEFNTMLVDVYQDFLPAPDFLQGFFPDKITSAKNVSIEVRRGTEKVAVDVVRGTQGNRNTINRSTQKIIAPPYYREYLDLTSLDYYDKLWGTSNREVSGATLGEWVGQAAEELSIVTEKILRRHELMRAQVLMDGIVELKNGDNIDYKRKADSKVDLGGPAYWTESGVNPTTSIEVGCKFLRDKGKSTSGEFNMICGSDALSALLDNPLFQDRANLRRISLVDMSMPDMQQGTQGGVFHGVLSAGSYKVRVWTYPETYENSNGDSVPYIDDDKIVLIPLNPRFNTSYGAVPTVFRDPRNAEFPEFIRQTPGKLIIGNYVDARNDAHFFDVKSAPVAIPVAVDQIYTAKVVA